MDATAMPQRTARQENMLRIALAVRKDSENDDIVAAARRATEALGCSLEAIYVCLDYAKSQVAS